MKRTARERHSGLARETNGKQGQAMMREERRKAGAGRRVKQKKKDTLLRAVFIVFSFAGYVLVAASSASPQPHISRRRIKEERWYALSTPSLFLDGSPLSRFEGGGSKAAVLGVGVQFLEFVSRGVRVRDICEVMPCCQYAHMGFCRCSCTTHLEALPACMLVWACLILSFFSATVSLP